MELHLIEASQIVIPKTRQRRHFDEAAIVDLATSLTDNGLLHPIIVRRSPDGTVLVAGERRLRALDIVWGLGNSVRCNGSIVPEGYVPCLDLGELSPREAFEAELEENIRRTDLSWQEKVQATAQLFELKRAALTERDGQVPSSATVAKEIQGIPAERPSNEVPSHIKEVNDDLMLARSLDDPDVAKAPSRADALKVINGKREAKHYAELGLAMSHAALHTQHTLIHGNCIEVLSAMDPGQYDVILTDPPYGIGADDFGDGGGYQPPGGHEYDDSPENFDKLLAMLPMLLDRVAKPEAHLYWFCDIDRFQQLKRAFSATWAVFRTPLIWVNAMANKAPWPKAGPMRKHQLILYAVKGGKNVTSLAPDVITAASDKNLGYHAQKPVELYGELLRRSVHPADRVLDPFCGTGPIFPAAHALKCIATGIDSNPTAIGIATKRLQALAP